MKRAVLGRRKNGNLSFDMRYLRVEVEIVTSGERGLMEIAILSLVRLITHIRPVFMQCPANHNRNIIRRPSQPSPWNILKLEVEKYVIQEIYVRERFRRDYYLPCSDGLKLHI